MPSVPFKIVRICYSPLKCNYMKNQKLFLNFFFQFWNLYQVSNILKKRMIVIANVFPKLQTMKILLRLLSKKRCFRTRFDSQHVKASQILSKSRSESFYQVFSLFSLKLIWKISSLVIREIWRVSINTFTTDGKYFVQDCQNLARPIQMQLFEK